MAGPPLDALFGIHAQSTDNFLHEYGDLLSHPMGEGVCLHYTLMKSSVNRDRQRYFEKLL